MFAAIYSVKPAAAPGLNIVGSAQLEWELGMPQHLIPFSDNGGGDSYCLSTSQLKGEDCQDCQDCQVVFWSHEDGTQEVVAQGFMTWLQDQAAGGAASAWPPSTSLKCLAPCQLALQVADP